VTDFPANIKFKPNCSLIGDKTVKTAVNPKTIFFQSNSNLRRLAVEFSTSRTGTHSAGLHRTTDQLITEAATYAPHNKRKRWPDMT
jgi:hypothetical protein